MKGCLDSRESRTGVLDVFAERRVKGVVMMVVVYPRMLRHYLVLFWHHFVCGCWVCVENWNIL